MELIKILSRIAYKTLRGNQVGDLLDETDVGQKLQSNSESAVAVQHVFSKAKVARKRLFAVSAIIIIIAVVAVALVFRNSGSRTSIQQSNISIDPNFAEMASLQNQTPNPLVSSVLPLIQFSKNFTTASFENSSNGLVNLSEIGSLSSSWNSANPKVRCMVLSTLYMLGEPVIENNLNASAINASLCFNGNFARKLAGYYLVPANVSNKVSLYELSLTGSLALSDAKVLSSLFKCGFYNGRGNETSTSLSTYMFAYPYNVLNHNSLNEYSLVSLPSLEDGAYSNLLYLFPQSDIDLMASNSNTLATILKGGTVSCVNYSIDANSMFYTLSLFQYASLQDYETLYDTRPPSPTIDFAEYSNGTLMLDLGDVSPIASGIHLYVDGNDINYTKYYSFIVANIILYPGNHTIAVYGKGWNATESVHFNPPLAVYVTALPSNTNISVVNLGGKPIEVYKLKVVEDSTAFPSGRSNITILPGHNYTYTLPSNCNYLEKFLYNVTADTSEGYLQDYYITSC